MRTRIETVEDLPTVVATWPVTLENPEQELMEVHAALRQVFVENGWERGMIIHDGSVLEINFGDMIVMLGELGSEDSAWLSERAIIRVVGPDEIAGLSVAANRQEQYSGGSRTAAQATTVEEAIAEARTLFTD